MSYCVGYYLFDSQIDIEPRPKQLLGPFTSSQKAKEAKHNNWAPDVFQTEIFEANSYDEAKALIQNMSFLKF